MAQRREIRPVPEELRHKDQRLYLFLLDLLQDSSEGLPAGFEEVDPQPVSGASITDPGSEDSGWAAANHEHDLDTTGLPGNVTLAASAQGGGPGVSLSGHTHGLDDNVVTLAKLAQVTPPTLLGRDTGGVGNVKALTPTEATTIPNIFTAALKGLVPLSGGGTTNFLRADATWAAPGGGGGGVSAAYVQAQVRRWAWMFGMGI